MLYSVVRASSQAEKQEHGTRPNILLANPQAFRFFLMQLATGAFVQ
jgi:hypothetical protein